MVMASEMMVHAAMIDGLYAAGIPQFGFERRGSPVASSVRIDDRPIREKTQIYNPDCIVISDETLLDSIDVFNGLRSNATMILNSAKSLDALNPSPHIVRLGLVDATKIALEVLGVDVTNTAMVAAFAETTGWLEVSSALEGIRRVMPPELAERNVEAGRRAVEEVQIFEL